MTGTVIDSLIVTLGLDPSNYRKGQQDAERSLKQTSQAADSAATNMQARGKQAAEFYSKVRNEFLALIAVTAGTDSLKAFAMNAINTGAAASRMAYNLNIGVAALQQWQNAVSKIGGDPSAVTGTMQGLTNSMEAFRYQGVASGQIQFLSSQHALRWDRDGNPDIPATLLAASAQMVKMSPQEANYFGSQANFDQGTINLLEKGPAAVQAALNAQSNNSLSHDQAANLAKLQGELIQTALDVEGFGKKLVADLEPAIDPLVEKIDDWTDHLKVSKQDISDFSFQISDAIQTFKTLYGWGKDVYDFMNAAQDKADQAGAWMRGHVWGPLWNGGSQEDVKQQIVSFRMAQGDTPQQAAAWAAIAQGESSLDPTSVNPKSGAAGLFQLLGSRAQAFQRMFGHPVQKGTVMEQLYFQQWEMQNGYASVAATLKAHPEWTPRQAADFINDNYEVNGEGADYHAQIEGYAQNNIRSHTLTWGVDPSLNVGAGSMASGAHGGAGVEVQVHEGPITIAVHAKSNKPEDIATAVRDQMTQHLRNRRLVTQTNAGLQ